MRIHKRRAKERRRDIKLMLLGSGQRLSHRKNVRRKLLTMGFKKVIIMEDIVSKANKSSSYGRLEQKFEWLMKRYNPRLFFAFFHNDAPMDAVIFEIGCICCRYGSRNIGKKLRFMFEKNYNYRAISTAYIKNLFANTPRVEFEEKSKHDDAASLIRDMLAI